MATVLVVEDRQPDRQYLTALLHYRGDSVIEAENGAAALNLLREHTPDLVISDLLMPQLDGYQLVRQMRADERTANIPVLFYSATYHDDEARKLANACGVVDILYKPIEPETLLGVVDDLLRRESARATTAAADVEFDRDHASVLSSKLVQKISALESTEKSLTSLVRIGRMLASEHDLDTLLSLIAQSARELAGARSATVGLAEGEPPVVSKIISADLTGFAISSDRIELPQRSVLRSVLSGESVRVRNASGRASDLGLPNAGDDVFSYLAVPITIGQTVHGWIAVRTKEQGEEFVERDEHTIVALGAQAAVAIENANLIQALEMNSAELRRQKAETDFALESAKMGLWQLDVRTRRLQWSPSMRRLFGFDTVEELPPSHGSAIGFIHPDDRDAFQTAMAGALMTRGELNFEGRIWPRNRTEFWAQIRGSVHCNSAGEAVTISGVAIDITQRKQLELQFLQAQKMEAVGRLASGIAHDFNNLLTCILACANFIVEDGDPRDRKDAEEIVVAGARAAALTKQLLAFTRHQLVHTTPLDINGVVRNVTQMLERLMGEQVKVTTRMAEALRPIRADVTQLEQVLMNMAVNARDAMPNGGQFRIETSNVELDGSIRLNGKQPVPGSYLLISISDTGVGMDDATLARLFEPFFTTKEAGKGTGLGLSTVYAIVTSAGGHLHVYSEVGHGTIFKIYWPYATDADLERTTASNPRPQVRGGTETILVAEDENGLRTIAQRILEKAGYRVLLASSSHVAEALMAQESEPVHLLFTDMVMPSGSGYDLYQKLLTTHPDIRVLYTSGYTEHVVLDQANLGPEAAFLQKPYTADTLVRRVREVLDRV